MDEYVSDFFSDSDSLSFASLSRSSSLIQFESLEKQLQGDTQSFGSTPSLYSVHSNLEQPNPSTNNKCESNRRLINDNKLFCGAADSVNDNNIDLSDNSSDTTESYSSDNDSNSSGSHNFDLEYNSVKDKNFVISKILFAQKNEISDVVKKSVIKTKNSIESLSEDSGYSENFTNLKNRSKSLVVLKESSSEELSLNNPEELYDSLELYENLNFNENNVKNLKIEKTKINVKEPIFNDVKNKFISVSLPKIFNLNLNFALEQSDLFSCEDKSFLSDLSDSQLNIIKIHRRYKQNKYLFDYYKDYSVSLPENLHLFYNKDRVNDCGSGAENRSSVANQNFDLYDFDNNSQQNHSNRASLTMSYANLNVLDDKFLSNNKMSCKNAISDDDLRTKILYEFSTNFDSDVSILNNRRLDFDDQFDDEKDFVEEEKIAASTSNKPPTPPPRKILPKKLFEELMCGPPPPKQSPPQLPPQEIEIYKTFDQDPTNLFTCYTESLEKCNFDNRDSTDFLNINQTYFQPINREFVSSTPNLNYSFPQITRNDDFHQSMRQITNDDHDKPIGILTAGSSKTTLLKGVSFCPIVSEISWKDHTDNRSFEECLNIIDDQLNTHIEKVISKERSPIKIFDHSKLTEIQMKPDRTIVYDRTTESKNNKKESTNLNENMNSSSSKLNVDVKTTFTMNNNKSYSLTDVKMENDGKIIKSVQESVKNVTKPEKKSFLSRFTTFRFSLKNKKKNKSKISDDDNQVIIKSSEKNNGNNQSSSSINNKKIKPDFVYIPLKGPELTNNELEFEVSSDDEKITKIRPEQTDFVLNNHLLISSKPPLPKLPPRVVGVCSKRLGKSAHVQRAREIDDENDGEKYCSFNKNRMMNGGCGELNSGGNADNKIGLIETNLDTHETIVTGKTRSLMELGPQNLRNHNKQQNNQPDTHLIATIEPRRPHKSMEFLLDKENHRNVLVSLVFHIQYI